MLRGTARWRQRNRFMFMNGLPLIVVLWMISPIRAGQHLSAFVGFKPEIKFLFLLGLFCLAEALITKHKVVMGLEVLRINGQHLLQLRNCVSVFALQEQDPAKIV